MLMVKVTMRALIILFFSSASVLALPRVPQRIVGGSVTTIEQYPHTVSMLFSNDLVWYSHDCGGTILTTTAILSAAHCFPNTNVANHRVRVGSTFSSSGGQVHALRQIINHPYYSTIFTNDNDIAVLRTASVIVYTNTVQPGRIAGSAYNVADNQPVWAIGWGLTQFGGTSFSEQLRHVQIWMVNQQICQQRYSFMTITDNMMCSGWLDVGGRDACTGDSGGPLLHNDVVVGVASFGIGCGDPYFPGIHARVSRYTNWITANAQ